MRQIGRHKVTCASVESAEVDSLFDPGETADVFYSDPPWGDGNCKYWATMCKKQAGVERIPLGFEALLDRLMGLVGIYVDGYVFIETGLRWQDQVADAMKAGGLVNVRQRQVEYATGKNALPSVLVSASTSPAHGKIWVPSRSDLKGAAFARECIAFVGREGGLAFDPCCGMGYTAKAAVAKGMRFYGNEFNPARLAKTEEFLSKHQ